MEKNITERDQVFERPGQTGEGSGRTLRPDRAIENEKKTEAKERVFSFTAREMTETERGFYEAGLKEGYDMGNKHGKNDAFYKASDEDIAEELDRRTQARKERSMQADTDMRHQTMFDIASNPKNNQMLIEEIPRLKLFQEQIKAMKAGPPFLAKYIIYAANDGGEVALRSFGTVSMGFWTRLQRYFKVLRYFRG